MIKGRQLLLIFLLTFRHCTNTEVHHALYNDSSQLHAVVNSGDGLFT